MGEAQYVDKPRGELSDLLGQGPYPATGPTTITGLHALVAELEKCAKRAVPSATRNWWLDCALWRRPSEKTKER
jgi:hypothetical protein